MRKYDIILLDADDTLFDFVDAEDVALRSLFRLYGIDWTAEKAEYYKNMNESLWRMYERGDISKQELLDTRFAKFFDAIDVKGIDGVKANADYLDGLSTGNNLLSGARDICEKLKSLGCELYVATNGVTRVQKKRLADSELNGLVDGIFVSEEAGAPKPNKEYFDYVFSSLKYPPKAGVLMVGDSLTSDMKGAVVYGIDSCWLNPDGKATDLPVTYMIKDISEVYEIVRGGDDTDRRGF